MCLGMGPGAEVWGWKHRNRESSQDSSLLPSLDGTGNRLRTRCCARGRDLGLLRSLGRLKGPKIREDVLGAVMWPRVHPLLGCRDGTELCTGRALSRTGSSKAQPSQT